MIFLSCPECKSCEVKPGHFQHSFICECCGKVLELHEVRWNYAGGVFDLSALNVTPRNVPKLQIWPVA